MDLSTLRSLAIRVQPIAFDVYDQAEQASILPRLALVTNNDANEDPVRFEWVGANLEARPWVDERTTQSIFKGDFSIPIEDFEATFEFNARKILRSGSLGASGMEALRGGLTSFTRRKLAMVFRTFRENPPAYDGQDFFDTDHVHPGPAGEPVTIYSNIVTPDWVDTADPLVEEMAAFLDAASGRLRRIGGYLDEVVDTALYGRNLVVVSHNEANTAQLERLRDQERLGQNQESNKWKGRFQLLEDQKPTAGQETYMEVLYSPEARGPRPVLFVVDQEPGELEVDRSSEFDRRMVRMGWWAAYGTKPGWPQTAVQGRPT
jgi:hypothetical protein